MVDVVNVQNNEQNYVFLVKIVNIMKQFTNKEQTRHLIELGFPKPKSNVDILGKYIIESFAYSIGELIELLPMELSGKFYIEYIGNYYQVGYNQDFIKNTWQEDELIDALYNACVYLKNKGVI